MAFFSRTNIFGSPTQPSERIPIRLSLGYTDINLISERINYEHITSFFVAKSKLTYELHTIKVLELSSPGPERDAITTLFLQELLYLCSTQPEIVLINSFIVEENTLAYATLHCTSLKTQLVLHKSKSKLHVGDINIHKIIQDVVTDLEIFWKELNIRRFGASISMKDIYYSNKTQKYWLGYWINAYDPTVEMLSYEDDSAELFTSQDISEELAALGMSVMQLKGINRDEIEKLRAKKTANGHEYDLAVENHLLKAFREEKELARTILRLVSRDKQTLPTINELKGVTSLGSGGKEEEGLKLAKSAHVQDRFEGKEKIHQLSPMKSSKIDAGNLYNPSFTLIFDEILNPNPPLFEKKYTYF